MESININIKTVNAAFDDSNYELARILSKLADDIRDNNIPYYLYDINGNKVGIVEIED